MDIEWRHRKPELMDLIIEVAADYKEDIGDAWVRLETDLQLWIDYWWVTNYATNTSDSLSCKPKLI